jgi:hypothetical protein
MNLTPTKQILYRHPAVLGLIIGGTLLLGLLLQGILLDRFPVILGGVEPLAEFRIAVVHCLLAAYLPSACLYLLRGARNTIDELGPILKPADDLPQLDPVADIGKGRLFLSGLIGVALSMFLPLLTAFKSPWDPATWTPEVVWHRILGPFIGWWLGWFVLAVWYTSAQTSRLAARIGAIDLFDLSPLFPFTRQGLLTALLAVGAGTIVSLFLLDPGQGPAVAIAIVICLPLAALGLLLPVRGAHRRIREVKKAELEWTRDRIRQSRSLLDDAHTQGAPGVVPGQMADLIAYVQLVDDAQEWPFQGSTFVQMVLYVLIPAGSWFATALVKAVVENLIPGGS